MEVTIQDLQGIIYEQAVEIKMLQRAVNSLKQENDKLKGKKDDASIPDTER